MKVDLTGQKFCRLTVLKRSENQNGSAVRWLCRCECGTETIATTNELRSGHKKSCGCLKHKPHPENLKGQRFGRLVVMKRIGTSESKPPAKPVVCTAPIRGYYRPALLALRMSDARTTFTRFR